MRIGFTGSYYRSYNEENRHANREAEAKVANLGKLNGTDYSIEYVSGLFRVARHGNIVKDVHFHSVESALDHVENLRKLDSVNT